MPAMLERPGGPPPLEASYNVVGPPATPEGRTIRSHYSWRRGSVDRTLVLNWRTFPGLRLIPPPIWLTCAHFVGKVSATGQPTSQLNLPPIWCRKKSSNPCNYMGLCVWLFSCEASPCVLAYPTVYRLHVRPCL